MSAAILLAVADPFLGLVLRQGIRATLPRAAAPVGVRNQEEAAAMLLAQPFGLLVLDRALLVGASPSLTMALRKRGGPTLLVGIGPDPVTCGPVAAIEGSAIELPQRLGEALGALLQAHAPPSDAKTAVEPPNTPARVARANRPEFVMVASSTGGPAMLTWLFTGQSPPKVPVLLAQHMPEDQTGHFAAHLAQATGIAVMEQAEGPLPRSGVVVLRGGHDWRVVVRKENEFALVRARPTSPYHPSADVLFGSAAMLDRIPAAMILTGMGQDGAVGAARLVARGVSVVVQHPDSCAVAGMPAATLASCRGGAIALAPDDLAARLHAWLDGAA